MIDHEEQTKKPCQDQHVKEQFNQSDISSSKITDHWLKMCLIMIHHQQNNQKWINDDDQI